MALETTVILRQLLYHVKTSKSLEEVLRYVEVMCSEEDIAIVDKKIAENKNDL